MSCLCSQHTRVTIILTYLALFSAVRFFDDLICTAVLHYIKTNSATPCIRKLIRRPKTTNTSFYFSTRMFMHFQIIAPRLLSQEKAINYIFNSCPDAVCFVFD